MAKGAARHAESFTNEKRVHEYAAALLEAGGFLSVTTAKRGSMKIIRARRQDGEALTFWLKQGWSTASAYAAMQFGMFQGRDGRSIKDREFLEAARHGVDSAITAGATHALLVHLSAGELRHVMVLPIESLYEAYAAQLKGWPKRARNTKSPTLWFVDERSLPDAACVSVVKDLSVELRSLASGAKAKGPDQMSAAREDLATSTLRETLVRLRQREFRARVGIAARWTCAVSGCTVKEALEAAHLPGRDWQKQNAAADGILLRADLHRLLDAGLATLVGGCFKLDPSLARGHYGEFDGRSID